MIKISWNIPLQQLCNHSVIVFSTLNANDVWYDINFILVHFMIANIYLSTSYIYLQILFLILISGTKLITSYKYIMKPFIKNKLNKQLKKSF